MRTALVPAALCSRSVFPQERAVLEGKEMKRRQQQQHQEKQHQRMQQVQGARGKFALVLNCACVNNLQI